MNSDPHNSKPQLHLDYCAYEAAKYACTNWHYSRSMPAGNIVKIGVWEDEKFIGVVLFAHGSTPQIGMPYNLTQFQCIELVRLAMTEHRSPVSKIVAIAIRMLKKQSPDLQLIVSYADPYEGHHGGIYAAGGWIYEGLGSAHSSCMINGRVRHRRSVNTIYGTSDIAALRKMGIDAKIIRRPGKHKYLFPLSKELEKRLRSLHKPYPKRAPSIDI